VALELHFVVDRRQDLQTVPSANEVFLNIRKLSEVIN
jgi:hypothetical protein